MANILLINPAPQRKVFSGRAVFLPLGLASIAAVLEKEGHFVRVKDLALGPENEHDLIKEVGARPYEVVGFTAVTPAINAVYHLMSIMRPYTSALFVLGGPHPSALPEEVLRNGADIVIRGEGEDTILDLLRRLHSMSDVPGISYRINGSFVHNPPRPLIKDLDVIPSPARHLFPPLPKYKGQPVLGNILPVGTIMASRGCPFTCNFCFHGIFGKDLRYRSIENVLDEWRLLKDKYMVREIAVMDDTFTTQKTWVTEFCEEILRKDLYTAWSCPNGVRVDTVDKETLSLMKKAGCYKIAFGIESGSQYILDKIGKNITLDEVRHAIALCRELKIQTVGFFVLGHPWDTQTTIAESIDFARGSGLDFVQFTMATPYPGTDLMELLKRERRVIVDNWDLYDHYSNNIYFLPYNMTEDELKEMYQRAYRAFYLKPGYIFSRLIHRHTYSNLWRNMKGVSCFLLHSYR